MTSWATLHMKLDQLAVRAGLLRPRWTVVTVAQDGTEDEYPIRVAFHYKGSAQHWVGWIRKRYIGLGGPVHRAAVMAHYAVRPITEGS